MCDTWGYPCRRREATEVERPRDIGMGVSLGRSKVKLLTQIPPDAERHVRTLSTD